MRQWGPALDVTGVCLLALAIAWTFTRADGAVGSRGRIVALLLLVALAYVVARALAALARWIAPVLVVVAVAVAVGVAGSEALSQSPLAEPLGYANANGSLFALAAVAALMLAVSWRRPALRAIGAVGALAFAAAPLATSARAAALLLLLFAPAALFARSERSTRGVVLALSAAFMAALTLTVVVGATAQGGRGTGVGSGVESVVTDRRVALWEDAWDLMVAHPLEGVGPGRFASESATALEDPDAVWAHHGFLQQGAEQGVIGFGLAVLLVLWGLARLALAEKPDPVTALGAVALVVLGVHACLDYVLHFAAVPIAAAALVGTGVGRGRKGRNAERHARP